MNQHTGPRHPAPGERAHRTSHSGPVSCAAPAPSSAGPCAHGPHAHGRTHRCGGNPLALGVAALLLTLLPGCASGPPADPLKSLNTVGRSDHVAAIEALCAQEPLSTEASRTMRRVLVAPGYNIQAREAAFNCLAQRDRQGLIESLQIGIGRMENYEFRRWILQQIGRHGWKDFTVVVVNSWAAAVPVWGSNDLERPEYQAMRQLYGPRAADGAPVAQGRGDGTDAAVVDALFGVLMDAHPINQSALRARTWELLMRLGQRERLHELVTRTAYRPDDVMLRDIRQLMMDLGILPETREELLWLAKLRQTATPAYWQMAGEALKQLPEEERRKFELRGVAVAIAASRHKPELLTRTREELYEQLVALLKARQAGRYTANFEGFGEGYTEALGINRDKLTWIDLAAMLLAIDMTNNPQVRKVLFDVGDRDQQDRRTEYGGVIRITDTGAYEVLEVPPRVTGSDLRYEVPQEAFDVGYTALFHFHFHAQSYDNRAYAGPHLGDFAYANSTRANCLVFSFVNRNALDLDFYRHGPIVVDLGLVTRE